MAVDLNRMSQIMKSAVLELVGLFYMLAKVNEDDQQADLHLDQHENEHERGDPQDQSEPTSDHHAGHYTDLLIFVGSLYCF